MESIKTFTKSDNIEEIKQFFLNKHKPFVIKNYVNSNIDLDFLEKNYGKNEVIILD